MTDLASPLYVELAGSWEELWCTLSGPNISCFDKVDDLSPCTSSNCGDVVLEVRHLASPASILLRFTNKYYHYAIVQLSLEVNSTTAKVTTIPLSALSKLLRTSKLPETPYFFNITISGNQYKFASSKEGDRSRWVKAVKDFSVSVNNIIKPISLNNAQTTIKSHDVSSFPKPKFGDDSLAASYDKVRGLF